MILKIPTLEDSESEYPSEPAVMLSQEAVGDEVFALACGSYAGVDPHAYRSHCMLAAQMGASYGKNLWVLPAYPRLAYPYSALYAVASMVKTEKKTGRRADWVLWLDDDVIVPSGLCRILRDAACPEKRPFVAALGFDRQPPFRPAVWNLATTEGGSEYQSQWDNPPESGTHEVSSTGLCAALLHRSIFDRVEEPWFAVIPREVDKNGNVISGVNPDAWFSQRCREAGISPYVCCDVNIVHLGDKIPVHRGSVDMLRSAFGAKA